MRPESSPITTPWHRYWTLALLWLCTELMLTRACASGPTLTLQITDPYIELHTGPGRAFPVFHVVERGDWIEVLKRKTNWYKVRTQRGKTGWVKDTALGTALTQAGINPDMPDLDREDFADHRWALSTLAGDFEDATSLTMTGGWFFSPNLGLELSGSHILDAFSDSQMADVALVSRPFPRWRLSPFAMLGTGIIHTTPKVTLVQANDKTDLIGHVGIGAQVYIDRRFVFRMQYKRYTIFQSIDDNQEINEWKAGFSVFF